MSDASKRSLLLQRVAAKLPENLQRLLQRAAEAEPPSPEQAGTLGAEVRRFPTKSQDRGYDEAIQLAWNQADRYASSFEHELRETASLLTKLMSLPSEGRRMYLLNQPKLHSIVTVTRLLRLSWEQRVVDPMESEELAALALEVLGRVEVKAKTARLVEDLYSRAWIHIGNARRIGSDLHGAQEALRQAREHVELGSQDPLDQAMLEHALGRLRQDQRRFADAIPLLQRASRKYRQVRDLDGQAHAMITLGTSYRDAGEPERGLEMMRNAEQILPANHPLLLHIRHNQIYFLIDLDRCHEAEALLGESRHLYAHASEPLVRLRLPWLEGRIAKHTGRNDDAEYLFQKVRQGFIEHGIAYDAAQVSLELAELYVQQGRNEELKELSQEMVTVFRSRNVEREALAALLMLRHAASAERASLHVIRDIAARLRERAPKNATMLRVGDV